MTLYEIKGSDGRGKFEINQYGGEDGKLYVELSCSAADWVDLSPDDILELIKVLQALNQKEG